MKKIESLYHRQQKKKKISDIININLLILIMNHDEIINSLLFFLAKIDLYESMKF